MVSGFFLYGPFLLTTTAAVVTDPFVLPFRFNHLRGKSNPAYPAADILFQAAVGTLADNMAEAEVADAVLR